MIKDLEETGQSVLIQQIDMMAKRLNMTSHEDEPEPYILTEADEQALIKHEVLRAKNRYRDSHLQKGERLGTIETKMAGIDWEQSIDKAGILKRGNANKSQQVWVEEKRKAAKMDELKKQKELAEKYTAKFMFGLMRNNSQNLYDTDLIINEENKHLITTICFFLSRDIRFKTELGYSFKKGLLIRGSSGLGKTFLVKCVKDNELMPIVIHSMIEIAETVQEQGLLELPEGKGITYLDDVGTEESCVKHYGTNINFFKSFIEKYYLNNSDFSKLMISTNNSFDEIQDKYTFRVRSRIKDMFNIVTLKGKDMRGGNHE